MIPAAGPYRILVTSVVIARLWDGEEGSSGSGSTGGTGGELRMSLASVSAESSLSPSGALYGTERLLAKQLYTGLVEVAPDGTFRNRLATRITPDPSCTTWQIDLRSGTRFSNGEQVTPESFIRGWNRAARDRVGLAALLIGGVRGFDEVQGGDSQTMTGLSGYGGGFQVTLTAPDCEFTQRLADPGLAPVPASAGAHDNAAYISRGTSTTGCRWTPRTSGLPRARPRWRSAPCRD